MNTYIAIPLVVVAACGCAVDPQGNRPPTCGPVFPPEVTDPSHPTIEPADPSMQPGETLKFVIAQWECCWLPVSATATPCIEWSVDKTAAGVIDGDGTLRLADDVTDGEQIKVRASFPEPDAMVMDTVVTVYRQETNPLVGRWMGRHAISCDESQTAIPEGGFGELIFEADGSFTMTWYPFEIYTDYWGSYAYDQTTASLAMQIVGGNYVPEVVDLEGYIEVQDDGTIILTDIYLGAMDLAEPVCGYLIE